MRIIGGLMKGTKLYTLEGLNTRPTLDRVKEALFSKIFEYLDDAIILDLFSGSGALGLESISRGAKLSVMCDSSRDAIKIIKQNIEKTRAENKTLVLNMDYMKALEKLKNENFKFNVIFLDPPYITNFAEQSVKFIIENNLLNNDGLIVLETDDLDKVENNLDTKDLNIVDIKKYGRVKLLFIKNK